MQYDSITDVQNNILNYWHRILVDADIDIHDIAQAENAVKQFGNDRYSLTGFTKSQVTTEVARRKEITGTPLDVLQQLHFILQHEPEEQKYDIEKVYQKSFDHAMKKPLPYVYFSGGKPNVLTRFELNYNKSIFDNANRYQNEVEALGVHLLDFIPYCCHNALFDSHYFRRVDNTTDKFKGGDTLNLIRFIQYLVTGSLVETYAETNKFAGENKIAYNAAIYTYTIGNISVKHFANGRIDIKGLTDAQQKIIDTMLQINDKMKNR